MKLLLVVLMGLILVASSASAGIVGSKHDLSTSGAITDKSTDQDRVCVFCHTPHNANPAVPLWNREMSTATFTPYTGLDLDHTQWTSGTGPNEVSKLCLSCHDGTVAVNSLINNANPTMGSGNELDATGLLVSSANIGTDFSDDHPISFDYTEAQATDGELVDIATVTSTSNIEFFGAGKTSMECSSCHDVHEYGATTDMQPFLNESKAASNLCLKCHVK